MLGKLKAWCCIWAGRKRLFVTASIKFSSIKGLLKMQHLKRKKKKNISQTSTIFEWVYVASACESTCMQSFCNLPKVCWLRKVTKPLGAIYKNNKIIYVPGDILSQATVPHTQNHSTLLWIQLSKPRFLPWHCIYQEIQSTDLWLPQAEQCREQTVNVPRAEPARQCLYPKSNSGTLQSYKWHFKVLKSTSCLRSYLAMTLSPRLLTKLALGDNCRGLQPSITKSKVNTTKQWQLESRWERIESASDGSASVFSALISQVLNQPFNIIWILSILLPQFTL